MPGDFETRVFLEGRANFWLLVGSENCSEPMPRISAIMKLLIIPYRTLAYISSICDSQNISFVQLNFSMEVSVTLMRSIGRTWKPSRSGGFSRPWWLWMAVAVDEGLSHVSMMLRCKVSSWVPLLVAQSSHTKGGRWHPMMYQILWFIHHNLYPRCFRRACVSQECTLFGVKWCHVGLALGRV